MRDTRDESEGPRVPLKTILQNFLNHVENLEARVREGDDAYEKEFLALKSLSESLRNQSEYSCSQGEQEVNRKKNRYKDILPFDHNRIQLSEYPGVPGSDYINASYIKGASGSNAYIACQGPLPHTVNDFWRLVVETEVQVIVMACNEQEGGKHKCERYWSEETDVECQYGKYFVRLLKSREICPDFLVRTMRLRWTGEGDDKTEEERTVCQFHYSLWPDHGIPTQVRPLLEMVRLIRDCQASETLPVLIHCSAGCGRTGTVCAIDFIWGLLRTGKLTSDFSLFNLVKEMRRQRIAMVQTLEQYILVHRAVKELFLEQMRVIDSHPYENVDDDGHPLVDNKEDTDYETVVVNNSDEKIEDHEVRSEVMDQVLSQRMQNRPLMGTAMLSSASSKSSSEMSSMLSNFDSLERPPQPPPKQRNLDSNRIDTRTLDRTIKTLSKDEHNEASKAEPAKVDIAAEFNKVTDTNLFEPPGNNNKAEPQKFKKGNLKLTQDDKGNWKIEENLDQNAENNNKVTEKITPVTSKKSSPKSKKSSSSSSKGGDGNSDSSPSETNPLLRRPSIKKIKAFFQQQKEASADLVSEAVSKLPTLGSNSVESKSVPSSLDRKYSTSVNNDKSSPSSDQQFSSLEKRPTQKPQGPRQPLKSVSSERLLLPNDAMNFQHQGGPGGQQNQKPLLPIKRSKSMKTIQKEDMEDLSFGFEAMNPSKVVAVRPTNPPPKPKRSLTSHDPESIKTHLSNYSIKNSPIHSRQSSTEAGDRPSMNDLMMASFNIAEKEASKIHNNSSVSGGNLTGNGNADYVNVNIRDGHIALAQRKISEASMNFPGKTRERRNSFREAMEKSDNKSYEPIWFDQAGESSSQQSAQQSPIYVNVAKRASPVRKASSELISVSLVSEVNKGLNKQNSNSSLTSSLSGHSVNNGKGPPPPYVQPPQPLQNRSSQQVQTTPQRSVSVQGKPCNTSSIPPGNSVSIAVPQVPTSSIATYANVQFRVKEFARPPLNSTKDDLVLTSNHTKLNRRKSTKDMPSNPTSKFPVNRYSVGDFSQLTQFNQFASSPKGYHMHSYSDGGSGSGESLNKSAVNSSRHVGVPTGGGSSEFDVDLDAIAATMQGHRTGTPDGPKAVSPQTSRPLKLRAIGMISGVATNLKSRLSQFNSSGSGSSHLSPGNLSSHHHQSDGSKVVSALHSPARSNTSSGSDGTAQASASSLSNVKRHSLGEQPASVIPLTVPGADATMPSFPYGYPERLDMKPVGPRDPPSHFQRKQEYL